jgi:hypothetical protein
MSLIKLCQTGHLKIRYLDVLIHKPQLNVQEISRKTNFWVVLASFILNTAFITYLVA